MQCALPGGCSASKQIPALQVADACCLLCMCVHTYSCGRSASPSVVEVTDSFVLQGTLSVKGRYKLESCTFKIGFEGCTSLSVAVR
eukprot:scaffold31380_cov22-Tisochrysis_lutea.AAC.1